MQLKVLKSLIGFVFKKPVITNLDHAHSLNTADNICLSIWGAGGGGQGEEFGQIEN